PRGRGQCAVVRPRRDRDAVRQRLQQHPDVHGSADDRPRRPLRRVRQLRRGLLAPTETSQSPAEARPKCRASTGVSAGAQAVQQKGQWYSTHARLSNYKNSRHQNRRGGGVSPDGRARARGRMLRRAALIAGALVLLTVVLLLTGHWVLAIIFAVPA